MRLYYVNHVTVYLSVHVCTAVFLITNDSRRKCGRVHLGLYGCSLTIFGVGGSQVCGKALAYCIGHSHAFLGYHYREKYTLGDYSVDGCSHHMRGHAPGVTCCQDTTTVDITTVPRRSYVISWF